MIIYLVRHGIASDYAPCDDLRPLTEEGIDKFRRAAGAYRKVMKQPDALISSPLLRARQTAELLADSLDVDHESIQIDPRLHHSADPTAILERLHADALEGTAAVALVGHEPHLGSLLGLLLTGSPRASMPLRKGMLVAVELLAPHTMLGRMAFALSQKAGRKLS